MQSCATEGSTEPMNAANWQHSQTAVERQLGKLQSTNTQPMSTTPIVIDVLHSLQPPKISSKPDS
jgi:hypothetical protein